MSDILTKESLKTISEETRQEILKLLSERPYTSTELSKKLNKHVTTVKEHLAKLEKSDFVIKKESTNKFIYYELSLKGHRFSKGYEWIIIFSLSAVFIFAGLVNLTGIEKTALYDQALKINAPAALPQAIEYTKPMPIIGIIFIILGLVGIIYLIYRK